MIVERRLRFVPTTAYDRYGRQIELPAGNASVTASPLMEAEIVIFEAPDEPAFELAPGEVGRLIGLGQGIDPSNSVIRPG
jgi:hypothetical protein